MRYRNTEGIIPRDIASIYFLVDIHDKTYYDAKRIYSTNQCGYEIFRIISSFEGPCTIDELFRVFITKVNDYQESMKTMVMEDISNFVKDLVLIGYISEV